MRWSGAEAPTARVDFSPDVRGALPTTVTLQFWADDLMLSAYDGAGVFVGTIRRLDPTLQTFTFPNSGRIARVASRERRIVRKRLCPCPTAPCPEDDRTTGRCSSWPAQAESRIPATVHLREHPVFVDAVVGAAPDLPDDGVIRASPSSVNTRDLHRLPSARASTEAPRSRPRGRRLRRFGRYPGLWLELAVHTDGANISGGRPLLARRWRRDHLGPGRTHSSTRRRGRVGSATGGHLGPGVGWKDPWSRPTRRRNGSPDE
jgi:hypothetical protein